MTSSDRIVIEGSIVRHERIDVVSESALSELEQHLVRYEATTFPVLPHGTVFLSYDRNTGVGMLLVETKPQRISLGILHRRGENREDAAHNLGADRINRFTVQLPYQYFAFKFRLNINPTGAPYNFTVDAYHLYWRRLPFTKPDDTLIVAHLPNVNDRGGICWGSTLEHTPNDNLATRISAMVNMFPHTTFNEDLGHQTPFGTSLLRWEQDSENPLNYMNWEIWENAAQLTTSDIAARLAMPPLPIAEINPYHIEIPELPENFTVGRAREWLNGLPEGTRRRMLLAITEQAEDLGEPVPTPQQIADALAAGAE